MSGGHLAEGVEIVLNGAPQRLAPGTTIDALVTSLQGSTKGVAVAINDELVPRCRWAGTALTHDDRIEVLVPTQGG